MSDEKVATPNEVRVVLDASPYGPLLRDDRCRHQLAFQAMAGSTDPMAREVGKQLLAGRVTTRQILRSSSYSDFVRASLGPGQRLDIGKLRADLAGLVSNGVLTGDMERDLRSRRTSGEARTGWR